MSTIKTKYKVGEQVWFYDRDVLAQGKIISIQATHNGSSILVGYQLERTDKVYQDYENDAYTYRYGNDRPATEFGENSLASSKEEFIKRILRMERYRHKKEIERIKEL